MTINILAFGIAKEIVGGASTSADLPSHTTVAQLRRRLEEQYPQLGKLASYMIAVNNEYAATDSLINEQDEVAIIPPVSGG